MEISQNTESLERSETRSSVLNIIPKTNGLVSSVRTEQTDKGGRPKTRLFRKYLRRALMVADAQGKRAIERMSDAMVERAIAGDVRAYEVARDTVDGKPTSDEQSNTVIVVQAEFL